MDEPLAPDFIALASRMAPDAAVSHHTALEAHGSAQSLFTRLTFVTWTRTKEVEFQRHRLVPVRPRVALLDYVRVLHNKTVAARVGYFLESRREELAVPASTLEALQGLLPGHPVHMERALGGRLNRRWRLIVPAELAGPPEEAGA